MYYLSTRALCAAYFFFPLWKEGRHFFTVDTNAGIVGLIWIVSANGFDKFFLYSGKTIVGSRVGDWNFMMVK